MRLAIIVSHPIQYYSPWFRHIAESMERGSWSMERAGEGGVDPLGVTNNGRQDALRVFYLWDFGVAETRDPGFEKSFTWDVPLLEGYDHEFVPNVSKRPGTSWFGGLDNPELLKRVQAFAPDAVLQFGYNYKSLVGFDLRWDTKKAPLLFRGDSHLLGESEESRLWGVEVRKWLRRLWLRMLFKRFAWFLAVGKANAAYFRSHGVNEKRIVFCPHAVDNEFFVGKENATSRGLRGELRISDDDLVFLYAGKFEEKKQPDLLLAAYMAADIHEATLLLVGNGPLEAALRAFITGRGWRAKSADAFELGTKRVVFLPFQNQSRMPDVYRTGDVLVLPSKGKYETWGLAVNEAACSGLPALISSQVGCGPDLIASGQTGWIFPAGNASALVSVLEVISADRAHLPSLGAALRDQVLRLYSYDKATKALLFALGRHLS